MKRQRYYFEWFCKGKELPVLRVRVTFIKDVIIAAELFDPTEEEFEWFGYASAPNRCFYLPEISMPQMGDSFSRWMKSARKRIRNTNYSLVWNKDKITF
jgi:hypothetical protein